MNYQYLKCLSLVSMSILASSEISAVTDNRITILNNGAERNGFNIENISRITFSEGNMSIHTTDGSWTFSPDEFDTITFDASLSSSSQEIWQDLSDGLEISLNNGNILITGQGMLNIRIYDMNGNTVHSQQSMLSANINYERLAKGIYIIQANNKYIKFTR